MANNKDFLGVGFAFPISPDKMTGRIKTAAYEEDIQQAIRIILMTAKGERVMRPDFGCDIHRFLFDTVNYTVLFQMKRAVEEALILWEPRIRDIQVDIDSKDLSDGKINILVSYVVRETNNPFNMVFPFYINEGFQ